MRFLTGLLLSSLTANSAYAEAKLSCTHYVYSDIPFVTITMKLTADGHIERLADITHYGSTQQIAIEENVTGPDQLYNLTVDADNPNGELFLEIYKPSDNQSQASFKAKLINPQSPAMKEMPGQCDLT